MWRGGSWFILGIAVGFLFCALMSFIFRGLFGFYYLSVGGVLAGISVVVALRTVDDARETEGLKGR